MIQTGRMRVWRGGAVSPHRRARISCAPLARLVALVAVLTMVAGGILPAHAGAAGAEPGLVMVICSDGVAKTVRVDGAGMPVEAPAGRECVSPCLGCLPAAEGDAVVAASGMTAGWAAAATVAFFPPAPSTPRSGVMQDPRARGPPSETDA